MGVFRHPWRRPRAQLRRTGWVGTAAPAAAAVGFFDAITSGGSPNPGDQPIVVPGLSVPPVAVILWTDGATADDVAFPGQFAVGFAASPTQRETIAIMADDGASPSNSGRYSAQKAIALLSNGNPTLDGEAELVSFDTSGAGGFGFTLHWSTLPSVPRRINYAVIAGSLFQAEVGLWTPGSGAGLKQKTGGAFRPDMVFLMGANQGVQGASTIGRLSLGAFAGAGKRGAVSVDLADASASGLARYYQRTTKAIVTAAGGTLTAEADFSQFLPDGWELNFSTLAGGFQFPYLMIKGGVWDVGSDTSPLSPGPKSTLGVGFASDFLMTLGTLLAGSTTIQAQDASLEIGASTGPGQSRTAALGAGSTAPQSVKGQTGAASLRGLTAAGAAAVDAEIASLDPDGFTENYDVADAIAREFIFVGLRFEHAAAPINTVLPVISGSPNTGQTLSTTNGTWLNSPTGFQYQWQRDNLGSGPFSNIGGATGNTYVLAVADEKCHIRCVVTAINGGGSSSATSNQLGPVGASYAISLPDGGTYVCANEMVGVGYDRQVIISAPAGNAIASGGANIVKANRTIQQIAGGAIASGGANTVSTGTPIDIGPSGDGVLPFLRYAGREIANAARTVSYLRNGLGETSQGHWEIGSGDVCDVLYREAGIPPAFFSTPAKDPAPWYDPNEPGSKSFLGLVLLFVKGYDSTVTRSVTSRIRGLGGGSFSGQHRLPREWKFRGALVSADDSGAEFGLRWLRESLQSPECVGCVEDYLDGVFGTNVVGEQDPSCEPYLTVRLVCPPRDGSNDHLGEWESYDARLTSGPAEVEPWSPKSQVSDTDFLAGCRDYVIVEFTMTAGNPFLYKPATIIGQTTLGQPVTECADICNFLFGATFDFECFPITPPKRGTLGSIITLYSPVGYNGVTLEMYEQCPGSSGAGTPAHQIDLSNIPAGAAVIVDSSRRNITISTVDSEGELQTVDGTSLVNLMPGQVIDWLEARDCDEISCLCVRSLAPCAGGVLDVTVREQLREG